MATIEEIKQIAIDFRNTIIVAKSRGEFFRDGFLEGFPVGCCGISSNLLGRYLVEELHVKCRYTAGKFGSHTHTWLTLEDENVIDITGDQFILEPTFSSSNIQPVYVGPLDDFHKLFAIYKQSELCEEEWRVDSLGTSGWSRKNLETYQLILGYLNNRFK